MIGCKESVVFLQAFWTLPLPCSQISERFIPAMLGFTTLPEDLIVFWQACIGESKILGSSIK